MIKGIKFDFGSCVLVLPPMSLGAIENMQERLESYTGGTSKEDLAVVVDAATAALRRNYPEMTRAQVGELIDLANVHEVFEALMDIGGLKRKEQEAAEASGEAPAPSSGASFTPT